MTLDNQGRKLFKLGVLFKRRWGYVSNFRKKNPTQIINVKKKNRPAVVTWRVSFSCLEKSLAWLSSFLSEARYVKCHGL